MTPAPTDPFTTLGVAASASEAELRAAYRRLAQRHHPDHNGGSPESAVRFAEIQEAYAHARLARHSAARPAGEGSRDSAGKGTRDSAALEARIAEMEAELRRTQAQRERATRLAQQIRRTRPSEPSTRPRPGAPPARTRLRDPPAPPRPSDAELGYVATDDSLGKILDDFADELSASARDARDATHGASPRRPRARGLADWFDELGSRLTGEKREDHDG